MQNSRRTRYRKQKSNLVPMVLVGVVILGVVLFVYLWQNTQQKTNTTAIQSTQSVNSVSNTQAVSTTTETTQEKPKLVVEHGVARVGDIIIVNKKYGVPQEYNPGENELALSRFMEFKAKMQSLGLNVGDEYSGFRSYDLQSYFYNNYVSVVGKERADKDLARPGYSEHQTGYAFDFKDKDGNLLGEVPGAEDAVEYIKNHAHEYGFIVRYLEGKEHITGYLPETWHVRYVGDLAEEIYRSGLTLEEFLGVEGGDYAN